MQTITHKVPVSESSQLKIPARIINARTMSDADFIEQHGSGTLRDNKNLGFACKMQAMSERCAYTFGYGFSAIKSHLLVFNNSISECDEKAYTYAGRWFKAYKAKNLFEEDHFEIKYISIKDETGNNIMEGIGIVVTQTSAQFIPDNTFVFAMICKYHAEQGKWGEPVNFA